jgi:hypothetical protein
MSDLPFETLPEAPASFCGTGVLARTVDALGFRYRWATEDLPDDAGAFQPCEGAMTLAGLLTHIEALSRWMLALVRGHVERDPSLAKKVLDDLDADHEKGEETRQASAGDARARTLTQLADLRALLARLDDDDLAGLRIGTGDEEHPVWRLVNGPLADALTHVGQVSSWRRMAGCPGPRADLFRGRPPKEG